MIEVARGRNRHSWHWRVTAGGFVVDTSLNPSKLEDGICFTRRSAIRRAKKIEDSVRFELSWEKVVQERHGH